MTPALANDPSRARVIRARRMAHAAVTAVPLLAAFGCMHLLGMVDARALLAIGAISLLQVAAFLYFACGGRLKPEHDAFATAFHTCSATSVLLMVAFSANGAGRALPLLVVPMVFAFASYRYGRRQLVRLAALLLALVAIEQSAAVLLRVDPVPAAVALLETAVLAVVLTTLAIIGGQNNDFRRRTHFERAMASRAFAQMREAVIALDETGRVRSLNAAAAALFELSPSDAIGEPLERLARVEEPEVDGAVLDALRRAAREHRRVGHAHAAVVRTGSGRRLELEVSLSALRATDGSAAGHVLVARDVGRTNGLIRELRHTATHDTLTGLNNRRGFFDAMQALPPGADSGGAGSVGGGATLFAMVIDLDGFKIVNDAAGHRAGDDVLCAVADMIRAAFPTAVAMARIGGDEFAVVAAAAGLDAARADADAFLEALSGWRFSRAGRVFRIAASIGIAPLASPATPDAALAGADAACFLAKERGRGGIQVFQPGDEEIVRRQREIGWVSRLQEALEQDRFVLMAQRVVAARGESPGERAYYELLLRMRGEDGRLVPPDAFLSAAQRFRQMVAIDRWVVRRAIEHARDWPGGAARCPRLAVNLSADSLSASGFVEFVAERLAAEGVPGTTLVFELTESAALLDLARAHEFVLRLQALGCRVALDDVGAGFSSLSHLRALPIDQLKIDGSFVRAAVDSPLDRVMVESLQRLADVLGIETVAEYVEDETIADAMRRLGVTRLQGYGVHRPQPLHELQREPALSA